MKHGELQKPSYRRPNKPMQSPKARAIKPKQLSMLPKVRRDYGGDLRKNAKNRGARPLASRQTIHLVMRSTKAKEALSFTRHRALIRHLVEAQANNASVKVISWANVGNHLHLHIQLPRAFRSSYKTFIRGLTGAIALKFSGANKNNKVVRESKDRFWDQRPFTRVLSSWREYANLRHYVLANQFEGLGFDREEARIRAYVKEAGEQNYEGDG